MSRESDTSDAETWYEHIRNVQLVKATPEVIQRITETAERSKRAERSSRDASRLQRCNYISSISNQRSLNRYKEEGEDAFTSGISPAMEHAQKAKSVRNFLSKIASPSLAPLPIAAAGAIIPVTIKAIEENDEEDEDMIAMEREMVPTMVPGMVVDVTEAQRQVADDVDNLLVQLIHEPTDDAEIKEKFLLFENVLDTVTALRETTIGFWIENRDQFESSSRQALERDISNIDNQDTMVC